MKLVQKNTKKGAITILACILLALELRAAGPYEFGLINTFLAGEFYSTVCDSSRKPMFMSFWFKPAQKISFGIQGTGSSSTYSGEIGTAYSTEPRGANCYTHDTNFGGAIHISLFIEPHPTETTKCKVSNFIIFKQNLVPCGSITGLTNIETAITFTSGTYDEIDRDAKTNFNAGLMLGDGKSYVMTLNSAFTAASIDTQFIEFLLGRGIYYVEPSLLGFFDVNTMSHMRRGYHIRDSALLTAKKAVQKFTHDNLRGFYLEAGGAGGFRDLKHVMPVWATDVGQKAKALLVHFYMTGAAAMTNQQVSKITIFTGPEVLNDNTRTTTNFHYTIRVTRDTGNNKLQFGFQRYLNNIAQGSEELLEVPFTGQTSWIHFTLSMGNSYVYFVDATTVKVKRTEMLLVWLDGTRYKLDSGQYVNDHVESMSSSHWSKWAMMVEIKLDTYTDLGMSTADTENRLGIRVFNMHMA